MLWLMKRLYTKMEGCVFYEYIVSDDDTTMKKYLTHPEKRPTGKVNIGGRLPKEIPVPKWFADPTHRAKCVAGKFFKYNKASNKMTKLDCLRLKKYYSYYIKTNRKKSVKDIMEHIMAPLDHLFDDHKHCDSSWCHKKRREEDPKQCNEVGSERNKEGYYRNKKDDAELYAKLCELYQPYITEERITQCKHEFDTQVNEGMNTSVAKYAPKNRHYSKSISLEARVKVAAGIYNCGYHFFWTEVMKGLEIESDVSLQVYLLRKDEDKLKKHAREHDHANMARRKDNEHAKLRKELDARQKNISKNAEYSPMVGCDAAAGVEDKSKVGRNKSKTGRVVCRHALYGCIGGGDKAKHKTERSKSCTFNGQSAEYIRKVRDEYFDKNPHAKVEYDKMYPEVVTVGNGKKKKKKRIEENMGGGNTGM